MPQEMNYENQMAELERREAEINQRLAQIANERTEARNVTAETYGVNATEVDLGSSEERTNLQSELEQIRQQKNTLFETRRQERIEADKQRRVMREAEINRNGLLQQAFKFFTYVDTATSQGYKLDGLTEDEVINLYNDFMNKAEYEQMRNETIEKMKAGNREVIIPNLKQETEKEVQEDYNTQIANLRKKEEEIRQRLKEIGAERTDARDAIAATYGVNATEVDLGSSEERVKLQEELDKVLNSIALLQGSRAIEYTNERKEKAAERQAEINKKDQLDQAYKFFTYLDTTTTKGYDVSSLTEDEVINLYTDYMNKPEYEQVRNETIEKMKAGDREVVKPKQQNDESQEMFGPVDPYAEYLVEYAGKLRSNPNLEQVIAANPELNNIVGITTLEQAEDYISKYPEQAKEGRKKFYERNNPEKQSEKPKEMDTIDPDKRIVHVPNPSKAIVKVSEEQPPARLRDRLKNWIKNNKKKFIVIACAAAGAIALTAALASVAMTGDASVAQQVTSDPSFVNNIVQTAQAGIPVDSVDPSSMTAVTDLANSTPSQFDPSMLSGAGHPVHITASQAQAGVDTLTTTPDYIVNAADIYTADGQSISTEGMSQQQVLDTMQETGGSLREWNGETGMGHQSVDEVRDILEGGRSR
ncbi:MAG: hypothetical protein IJ093_04415 [Bacilli bacterium]|nr:hypothetical protein [Bacilli bacterium]